ncbi:hypothetical protein BSG18_52250 [Pseudomonas ogarae]|nr:hypothetical protein BSF43_39440 [Pseudomonas ogarae]PBJ17322.1 hypothetical protein BSG18_52250 [Pseudomonas ogarae]
MPAPHSSERDNSEIIGIGVCATECGVVGLQYKRLLMDGESILWMK